MDKLLSIRQAAEAIGVRPRDISDAAYQHRLTDRDFVMVAGRRHVPENRLQHIAAELRSHSSRRRQTA